MFADDTTFQQDKRSIVLSKYATSSGSRINYNKTKAISIGWLIVGV